LGWKREKLSGVIEWKREKLGEKKKEKLPKIELWQHPNETQGVQININNMANTWDIIHKWNWPQFFFNGLMGWTIFNKWIYVSWNLISTTWMTMNLLIENHNLNGIDNMDMKCNTWNKFNGMDKISQHGWQYIHW